MRDSGWRLFARTARPVLIFCQLASCDAARTNSLGLSANWLASSCARVTGEEYGVRTGSAPFTSGNRSTIQTTTGAFN
eukprot:423039-Alexandrium_andersonii.AAC.1